MVRTFSKICEFYGEKASSLLETLVDSASGPDLYQETMFKLGTLLGDWLLREIDEPQDSVYLACTVEDADFLAKGILAQMEEKISHVPLACFWNQRFSPFDIDDIRVAPIVREFWEPHTGKTVKHLIVVKSIISGACVVRTNLEHLIEKIEPERIFVVAPVIYEKAEEKLRDEFDQVIYDKFEFFFFAKDSERKSNGEVVPGIGGNVYKRLGFGDQDAKNRYTPEIVKRRRSQLVAQ
jgi:hypothetical protein